MSHLDMGNEEDQNKSTDSLDTIKKIVKEEEVKSRALSARTVLAMISPAIFFVNLPLFLLIELASYIAVAKTREKSLTDLKMPDSWLDKVSNYPDLDYDAHKYLVNKINKNGHINVSEAIHFVELQSIKEQSEEKRRYVELCVAENPGVKALLDRKVENTGSVQSILTEASSSISETFEQILSSNKAQEIKSKITTITNRFSTFLNTKS